MEDLSERGASLSWHHSATAEHCFAMARHIADMQVSRDENIQMHFVYIF